MEALSFPVEEHPPAPSRSYSFPNRSESFSSEGLQRNTSDGTNLDGTTEEEVSRLGVLPYLSFVLASPLFCIFLKFVSNSFPHTHTQYGRAFSPKHVQETLLGPQRSQIMTSVTRTASASVASAVKKRLQQKMDAAPGLNANPTPSPALSTLPISLSTGNFSGSANDVPSCMKVYSALCVDTHLWTGMGDGAVKVWVYDLDTLQGERGRMRERGEGERGEREDDNERERERERVRDQSLRMTWHYSPSPHNSPSTREESILTDPCPNSAGVRHNTNTPSI